MDKEKTWTKLFFISWYYGGHDELGETDIMRIYYFHPDVDDAQISQWENARFGHGHFSENEKNTAFNKWLEGLPEGYYTFENYYV